MVVLVQANEEEGYSKRLIRLMIGRPTNLFCYFYQLYNSDWHYLIQPDEILILQTIY